VIIVRRKAEVLRLGIFLVLMGLMAYFVMTKAGAFQEASGGKAGAGATAAGGVIGTDVGKVPAPAGGKAGAVGKTPATGASASPQDAADFPPLDNGEVFAEARLARDQGRSLAKQELQALIDNPNVDADVRKSASAELRAVLRYTALETQAEALLLGRGLDEVLVTMSESGVMVDVKAEDHWRQQALQLADAVATVTGQKLNEVKVRFLD
jgi:hypothetical protein